MRKLSDSERRGRPDIVQICLLTALDSPLNREGQLKPYVHTRHDKIIEVSPETRLPRSYNRFIGLMEQLFLTGGVPPEDPLMVLEDKNLSEKVQEINPGEIIALANTGKKTEPEELFQGLSLEDDLCVLVGGFPHEDFLSNIKSISDQIVSIYPETLDAVTALTHIIQFYEEKFGLI